jgi:hypothetical protein
MKALGYWYPRGYNWTLTKAHISDSLRFHEHDGFIRTSVLWAAKKQDQIISFCAPRVYRITEVETKEMY